MSHMPALSADSDVEIEPVTTMERPTQKAFTEAEQDFLKKFIDEYTNAESSNTKKGTKKQWVKDNVYYKYIAEFKSDGPGGPNLSSLYEKMMRWFSNRTTKRGGSTKPSLIVAQPIKKPRATNTVDLFAKSHQDELRAAATSKMDEEGTVIRGANLALYHDAKRDAYVALPGAEKAKWEALAKEHNDRIKEPPSTEYIYEHQNEVADNATAALWGLRGNDWGQYGEVIFFLQGAFRTKENAVKTFHSSVGIPSESGRSFQQDLDWTEHRWLFKKWASEMIPVVAVAETNGGPKDDIPGLIYRLDGSPLLPSIELKAHAPDIIVKLLNAFMIAAWKHAIPPTVSTDIPWNTLNTYITATSIPAGVTTMVPEKMSVVEAYLLYNHILLLQDTPDAFKFTAIDEMADNEIIGSHLSPGHGLLANEDSNMSMIANSPATGVFGDVGGSLSSSGRGSLANEDSNISTLSTGAVTVVLSSVSDINDGSSDAILKPGTKSTKKRPSKDNEIPDGVPAKKQRKSNAVEPPSGPSERPKCNRVQVVKTGVVDLKGKETVVPKKHGFVEAILLLMAMIDVKDEKWTTFDSESDAIRFDGLSYI
ncbi:hypothetical protein PILCRDRAFT_14861 [Piloderma croceum F 1598]|uniref:Uncharacterized protein n=1 Tax=Piloderma croceum (strain F 1598) TaxID=765440 RepID=A0A0C3F1N6_PILCF|nr:hypothetical protein PILCRDRAFT_14861 [Piloderma croceum F 1598]